MDTEPITERNPRILFCSSVNLRKTRHRLETSASGPPNKRNNVRNSMLAQGACETNVGTARPTSEKVFELPIPPVIKPRMEDALRSGLSSSQPDRRSNDYPLALAGRIGIYV